MSALRRSYLAGLLGQGVKPSLTPEMHEREAERQGIRYVYKTVDLDDDQASPEHLRALLGSAVELGFDGLNVTHPVKQAMVPLVDRVTADVAAIGALNTILISDGETVGHNTDVTGFARAFRDGLADVPRDEVVLLGAGGAGTAVAHALLQCGVRRLLVVDPDRERAETLVASAHRLETVADVVVLDPGEVGRTLAGASGLVNATPLGMEAHPGSPVDPAVLRPGLWVADIVYRPLVTALLTDAGRCGCRTLNGAGMAVHQAADAFELITGLPARRAAMVSDFDSLVADEVHEASRLASPARETSQERIK